MKLLTYWKDGLPEPGVLSGDQVMSLRPLGFPDVISFLHRGRAARDQVERLLSEPDSQSQSTLLPLASLKLMAPIPRPGKIICIGLNYRKHCIESKMEIPRIPTVFGKLSNAVIGPGDPIVLPAKSSKPDYEAEMAFVIGKCGRNIASADWKNYVAGYLNFNDVSARDYQMATSQWLIGKSFDTFAPMGPYLVTADEIADPHSLDISITVNGEVLQQSNTRELIFRIPQLVEFLSSVMTLEPGDIISTGTPAGVGLSYSPPRWLKPGDEVVVRVESLGELRNPVVAES